MGISSDGRSLRTRMDCAANRNDVLSCLGGDASTYDDRGLCPGRSDAKYETSPNTSGESCHRIKDHGARSPDGATPDGARIRRYVAEGDRRIEVWISRRSDVRNAGDEAKRGDGEVSNNTELDCDDDGNIRSVGEVATSRSARTYV